MAYGKSSLALKINPRLLYEIAIKEDSGLIFSLIYFDFS